VWIVYLDGDAVEVYRSQGERIRLERDATLSPTPVPSIAMQAADLMP
jgi:hypothetical protein